MDLLFIMFIYGYGESCGFSRDCVYDESVSLCCIVSAVDCTINMIYVSILANENNHLWRCVQWNEFDWFMMMRVLILPFELFHNILPVRACNHGGRVVKALDLRSNGRMSAWVRTPPVVDIFTSLA